MKTETTWTRRGGSERGGRTTRTSPILRPSLLLFLVLLLAGSLLPVHEARAQDGLRPLVEELRPLLDLRLRYEHVDQADLELDAHALTLRIRGGVESGEVRGFRLLAEADLTRALGIDDFNSTTDGPQDRPVVADPDSERLNRLHLSWRGLDGWTATLGRQRIIQDHARFVGNVGFRQNEQTFDAFRLQGSPASRVTVDYSYLWQVNRIFGSNAPAGTVSADTHLARVALDLPVGVLSGHLYLTDLEAPMVGASNRTVGIRLTGARDLPRDLRAGYRAGFSQQEAAGENPTDFSLAYWELGGDLRRGPFSLALLLEVMEGDGSRGFGTPLATLHAFQGFADVFLATPPHGIQDRKVALAWDRGGPGDVRAALAFHDYRSDRRRPPTAAGLRRDLGQEWNLTLSARPHTRGRLVAELADYRGAGGFADVRKLWLSAEFVLP